INDCIYTQAYKGKWYKSSRRACPNMDLREDEGDTITRGPRKRVSRKRGIAIVDDDETLNGSPMSGFSNPGPTGMAPVTNTRKRTCRDALVHMIEDDVPLSVPLDRQLASSTHKCMQSPWSGYMEDEEMSNPIIADASLESTPPRNYGPKTPLGASVAINQVRPHFDTMQQHILDSFCARDLGTRCRCGKAEAGDTCVRCRDCFKAPLLCDSCLVSSHVNNPFHVVERWTGTHFERTSLQDCGMVIFLCLNSAGERCPQVTERSARCTNTVVVGDITGFQTITMEFCSCVAAGSSVVSNDWQQLMALRLYPATRTSIKTVFTWRVLKQFHIHSLTSKKSAYDYVGALRKLTDNVSPSTVPDRYHEFKLAHRIWRFLALKRRTGQVHGFDKYVTNRRKESLAVRCPACPEVGFNMTHEAMVAASPSERHKYTLYLSVDGNFKLQRKNKRDDPNDVALNDGNGYFVHTATYNEYVKQVRPVDETSTCSHLRAARMQNIAKFKNAVISGVVGVQCARHGFYMPQGMVDLKKGEAFSLTDYALVFALAEAWTLRWVLVTYDIWCQYHVNLRKRIEHWFPSMAWLFTLVVLSGAIGKMHILNHQAEFGEMIEAGWAEHNLAAGSSKEENDGNRHDSIDDISGSWNWDKTPVASALQHLSRVCHSEKRIRSDHFEELNKTTPAKKVCEWEAMDVQPRMVEGKLVSVFQTNFNKGPPTHADAYARLLAIEGKKSSDLAALPASDLALVTSALLLERDQHHVRRMIATKAEEALVDAGRLRVFKSLLDFQAQYVARIPVLASHMRDVDAEKPELESLFLPSCFSLPARTDMQMMALANIEYNLREGQAFDALAEVRTAIQTLNYNIQLKKTQIHGIGANTKTQNYLRTLSNNIQIGADKYRRSRKALIELGLPVDDGSLRPLEKEHLVGKSGRQSDVKEWEAELQRVQWFQARALRDRAVEEGETLHEEWNRTIAAFENYAAIWVSLAQEQTRPGGKAYGYKQAAMYTKLADGCREARAALEGLYNADFRREEEERVQHCAQIEKKRQSRGDGFDEYEAYYETIEILPV
ncbi:unnamed protein product, partial [Mycena citricolor]